MDRNKFFQLHELIKDDIKKTNTNIRESISSLERLAVTLRFLAAGDTFRSIAYSYRMGERTVSKIVEEVCQALWERLQSQVLEEPNTNDWKEIAKGFKDNCQFDHCVGAIDGKHVTIKAPPNSGSSFFNYKKTFSIVLLAVVDSNRKFIYIDVGSMGRFSDSGILNDSTFGRKLRTGGLNLPSDEPLYPGGVEIPYVFVGDEAFPLMTNLMRAYPQSNLSDSKRIYNYRLCRARRVVENAFEILAARFRIFRTPLTTCALHNYLIKHNFYDMRDDIEALDDRQLTPLAHCGFRCSNDSFFVREEFCQYFNGIGAVPWQSTRVSNILL
ncbi:putative nuclease HARBI1 [Anthonomus grandis grandis]|uniref:putative nuclease HARBI1 n=1 Tax=Anthonomus grandis grandis TaxID=2921223 RepID=UPI0021669D1D|nr:putative nuclease HARBI1 [Anthonomus grandis grandis]